MRIDRISGGAAFKQLLVRTTIPYYINESQIKASEKKLMNTKFVDIIFDSKGFAIKDKMTDSLHRIQSFSFFPPEKAVGIRMVDEKEPFFKFFYKTKDEAKSYWDELRTIQNNTTIERYTQVALWLERELSK